MSSTFVQHIGYVDSLSVTTSLCLTYTLLILGVRMYIRNKSWGTDDFSVFLATLITLIHFAISYACLAHGLGTPESADIQPSLERMNKTTMAGIVTFVLSIYLAKIATLAFMLRIASVLASRLLYQVCIGISMATCLASILLVTADCPTPSGYYWNISGNGMACPTQSTRWQAMTILDIVSEVVLLILPVQLVWSLQMPRATKGFVIATFWTRIPVIGLTVVRQSYVRRLSHPASDKSLVSALVVILMEIQAAYALACCTIATAKNFVDNFNTGFGIGHIRGAADEYNMSNMGSSTNRTTKAIELGTLSSVAAGKSSEAGHKLEPEVNIRNIPSEGPSKKFGARQAVRGQGYGKSERKRCSDDGSTESDELYILRQTEYRVSHDEAPILRSTGGPR